MDVKFGRAIDTPIENRESGEEDHGAEFEEETKPLVSSKPKFKFKVGDRELVNGDGDKEEVRSGCRQNDGVWICQLCGKEFDSGKGLGGHMRVHKKRHAPDSADAGGSNRKSDVIDLEEEEQLTCLLCPKTFSSRKQLYGHMRLHPGRGYRGMIPPANVTAAVSESCGGDATPSSTIESEYSSSPGVDLVRCIDNINWPVKKSRTIKTSTAIDSELNEDEIGAAQALMLLATGDNRYRLIDHTDEIKSAKKLKLSSDNSKLNTDSVKKRKKITETVQINDLVIKDQSPIDSVPKSYKCSICNKSYPTPQGLGCHKSSAHKPIECGGLGILKPHKHDDDNQEAQVTIDIVVAAPVISHICKFCNKAFQSGQALGGHMRRHWPGATPRSANTVLNADHDMSKEPAALGFDLNELPEVDDCGELAMEDFTVGVEKY